MDCFQWGCNNNARTQYFEEISRLLYPTSQPQRDASSFWSPPQQSNSNTQFDNRYNGWATQFTFSRQRLNSTGSMTSLFSSDDSSGYNSECSPPISPLPTSPLMPWDTAPVMTNNAPKPWDDFAQNGVDCDLDEIDKIMRRNNLDTNVRSSALGQGRAAELLETDDPSHLMKHQLLLLIREAEKNKCKKRKKPSKVCVFCKNNGEIEAVYSCHSVKDDQGRVTCPILFNYKCPKCGVSGQNAHTLKYCPMTTEPCPDIKALRLTNRTSTGKRRAFPSKDE